MGRDIATVAQAVTALCVPGDGGRP
jgi:hypothetical protein